MLNTGCFKSGLYLAVGCMQADGHGFATLLG